MVPSAVATVPELPLTAHGKLDHAALPEPETPAHEEAAAPPRTPQEEALCALFAETLRRRTVARDEDFFALGGHSLLATRLVSKLRSTFDVELPVRALFEAPTPAALATRVGDAAPARPPLRPTPRPDRVPVSHAQRRLWFLHRMDPADPAYHLPVAVRLSGPLDRQALHTAVHDLLGRHESLRTVFDEDARAEPFQTVLPVDQARAAGSGAGRRAALEPTVVSEDQLAGALRDAAARPFDLSRDLPLRCELFTLGAERHVLLLTLHHIAADGWSMAPLARDLATAYTARVGGAAPAWEPLPVQYADYTLWQRALLGTADDPDSLMTRHLDYFRDALSGAPDETPLPVDRPRPAHPTGAGGRVPVPLTGHTARALTQVGKDTDTSTFMVLHAALAAVLTGVGAGDDLVVGAPVAGRTDEALGDLVGFFVNTLALRVSTAGNPTFRDLLGRVREADLSAYAHQDLPFERLVEALRPARTPARHPLFTVLLALNNTTGAALDLPGLHAAVEDVDAGGSKFALSFNFTERPTPEGTTLGGAPPGDAPPALDGELEFSQDLFDTATARRLATWFGHLLHRAVTAPDTPLSSLPLLTDDEHRRMLAHGHGAVPQQGESTVLDRFAETVARAGTGDVAVTAPDGTLTFHTLDARSQRIAEQLRAHGVRPGDLVAVLLPRCTDSLAALCGVFKAGGVYTPIDESLPERRIQAILADARPALTLTCRAAADRLPTDTRLLLLDQPLPATGPTADPAAAPLAAPRPEHAAYLIHTSGSTGQPKGVLVEHRSLARLGQHQRAHVFTPAVRAAGGRRLRVALTTSLSFDASLDPVLWLLDGHPLHLVDDLTRRDPEALVRYVHEHHLDVLESTPTHMRQLLDAGLLHGHAHRPAVLALGGEAVPPALWDELRTQPGVWCWNFYGPSEATVDTVQAPLDQSARPVLGTPVTGTRAHVLDAALRPTPPGVVGELYLAGDSLARGYLGRPAETACRFLPDPHGPPGSRMYRTGDLARRAPDGELEFAGRSDGQVTIRGFRVEPDEIAAALEQHPTVARAAVLPREDTSGTARLTAYLVSASGGEPNGQDALRAHAAAWLPSYMVPDAWMTVPRLPLTPSGKLDHAALPAPDARQQGTNGGGSGPRGPREDLLCGLFADVLGVDQVRIEDDFFALGGHSLLATRLVGRVRETLGVDVSIRALFEAPTVAAFAERLDAGGEDNALATLLPLRGAGDRTPLFCVHPAGGLAWVYAGLLASLGAGQPLYGLQAPNLDGGDSYPRSIEELAAAYVAAIRTVRPHGPYQLLGWSFGGNLAHEVAVQLQEAGEDVALLAILDAYPLAPLDDLDQADRATVFRALLDNLGMDNLAAGDPGGGDSGADDDLGGEGETGTCDTAGTLDAAALLAAFRRIGSPLGALAPETIETMVDNFADQARLMRTYTPRTFHGDVLFFTATEGTPHETVHRALWEPHVTGHIENHDVPCAHAQMMLPPAQQRIGPVVAEAVRAHSGEP